MEDSQEPLRVQERAALQLRLRQARIAPCGPVGRRGRRLFKRLMPGTAPPVSLRQRDARNLRKVSEELWHIRETKWTRRFAAWQKRSRRPSASTNGHGSRTSSTTRNASTPV